MAGIFNVPSDCILSDSNLDAYGYARIKKRKAHRVVWEEANGPIPEGLDIDHLCNVRNCVNVEHMQLLTPSEHTTITNQRRWKDGLCKHGHPFDYVDPRGKRGCKTCRRDATYRHRYRDITLQK